MWVFVVYLWYGVIWYDVMLYHMKICLMLGNVMWWDITDFYTLWYDVTNFYLSFCDFIWNDEIWFAFNIMLWMWGVMWCKAWDTCIM